MLCLHSRRISINRIYAGLVSTPEISSCITTMFLMESSSLWLCGVFVFFFYSGLFSQKNTFLKKSLLCDPFNGKGNCPTKTEGCGFATKLIHQAGRGAPKWVCSQWTLVLCPLFPFFLRDLFEFWAAGPMTAWNISKFVYFSCRGCFLPQWGTTPVAWGYD